MDAGASDLWIRVFGPPQIRAEGEWNTLVGPAKVRLFCALVASLEGELTREQLMESLWRNQVPSTLRSTFARTRKGLPPGWLPATEPKLVVGRERVDCWLFDTWASTAQTELERGRTELALETGIAALRLFRGEPYAGVSGVDIIDRHRLLLESTRSKLIADLLAASAGSPRLDLLYQGSDALAASPTDATLAGELARGFVALGRKPDAGKVLDQFRVAAEQHGVPVPPDLEDLDNQVRRVPFESPGLEDIAQLTPPLVNEVRGKSVRRAEETEGPAVVRAQVAQFLWEASRSGDREQMDDAAWLALTTIEGQSAEPDVLAALGLLRSRSVPLSPLVDVVHQVHEIMARQGKVSATDEEKLRRRQASIERSARALGNDVVLCRTLYGIQLLLQQWPEISARLAVARERVELASRIQDNELLRQAVRHAIPVELVAGNVVGAKRLLFRFAEIDPTSAEVPMLRAALCFATGGFEVGLKNVEDVGRMATQSPTYQEVQRIQLWWWMRSVGLLENVIEMVRADAESSDLSVKAIYAYSASVVGRHDEASGVLHQVMDRIARHELRYVFGGACSLAGFLYAACGADRKAYTRLLFEELQRFSGQLLVAVEGGFILGAVDRFLAKGARTLGDPELAQDYTLKAHRLELSQGFTGLTMLEET